MTVHAQFEDFALREIVPADTPALLLHLNDPEVVGWLARPPYPYLTEHAETFLTDLSQVWPRRTGIDVDGELVGVVSVDPHLGYWLAPGYWRRGIAFRAARAILDGHFAATGADEVASGVFEGNAASAGLLAKLGFRETGRHVAYCLPLQRDRVHVDYVLARQDWQARRGA
jgi:RimJ/RimL family protein N-acetyltransferase